MEAQVAAWLIGIEKARENEKPPALSSSPSSLTLKLPRKFIFSCHRNPIRHPNPYPYHYPYPPPPNHGCPPTNSDPYQTHTYPYQYQYNSPPAYPYSQPPYASAPLPPAPASYSGPLDYQHHPPSPSTSSHSGHLDYQHHQSPPHSGPIPFQYPYPPATMPSSTLQHHGSFHYGSPHHTYQQESGVYPPPESNSHVPDRVDSLSSHYRQDSWSSVASGLPNNSKVNESPDSHSTLYPSIDELLSNVHISGDKPTVPASPPTPSAAQLQYSPQDGIMATHDEETRRFFKHSSVQVLLCPRIAGKRHSWVKQREVGTIYTHHQKTVVVDADAGNNQRKVIAFVGGLDLCNGRYDTPQHPILKTLQTVHKDDYHNPTYQGNTNGCPREPWHDLHCKIDGPAAYDVLTNFQDRWLKAAKPKGIKKLKMSYDDALLRIERIPDILGVSDVPCVSENEPEAWHVQIFRSIDSNSVKAFPKDPREATCKNLVCGKDVLIDMSIHTAYVKAIRAAQHFIYIENQYFIGSSYNWSSYKDSGANNLIPMEIALKIAEKIRSNERFAAYIVVPMWPEGVPTGAATQRILFWQHKTMQMMYETIYKTLVEVGLEGAFSPQDYLNFFCLGNREAVDGYDASSVGSPTDANTPQALGRRNRRFMIYVHSKGMIVDDEYVILGSANINQRSMAGTRDTEIAMGAYQPHHTWAGKQSNPHGQA
ncbi:putative phospholipase d beta [Tripterygium wilfordii]|uniref:Phospholipase D alpha 1 n=1 Tax=Tripterygium wilfordii TaxID=458696 RepID=A0A7J7DDK9_TRIWF|nr:putative phospholipase d beta [Tripterygium wilfordii]